jgi:transcriptional regulator with XRE-family HTH domain
MEDRLSQVIIDFRNKELGLTQKEFAAKVGISNQTENAIENGKRPSLKVYEKLAATLGVDAKDLRVLKTKEAK